MTGKYPNKWTLDRINKLYDQSPKNTCTIDIFKFAIIRTLSYNTLKIKIQISMIKSFEKKRFKIKIIFHFIFEILIGREIEIPGIDEFVKLADIIDGFFIWCFSFKMLGF